MIQKLKLKKIGNKKNVVAKVLVVLKKNCDEKLLVNFGAKLILVTNVKLKKKLC